MTTVIISHRAVCLSTCISCATSPEERRWAPSGAGACSCSCRHGSSAMIARASSMDRPVSCAKASARVWLWTNSLLALLMVCKGQRCHWTEYYSTSTLHAVQASQGVLQAPLRLRTGPTFKRAHPTRDVSGHPARTCIELGCPCSRNRCLRLI